jgi:hypothetical protein
VDHDEPAVLGLDRPNLERDAIRVRAEEEDGVGDVSIFVEREERAPTMADDVPRTVLIDVVSGGDGANSMRGSRSIFCQTQSRCQVPGS